MKKFISLFLAIVIIFTSIPSNVFAADTANAANATVCIESTYAEAGTTVEVNVNIIDNPGIAGATFTLTYHEDLTLVNAVKGTAFSALDYTQPGTFSNPCNFTWDSENAEATEDGVILTLTFQVSETAELNAELDVDISYRYGDVFDNNDNNLTINFTNGTIMVLDYLPGDLYEDGIRNTKDTRLIRQYIAGGYDITINEKAADVNDDGVINTKDTRLLRRFIAGGYGVELLPSTPKCNHTMTATAAKDATCTETGNIPYWYCTTCEKYFRDENGSTEVARADTVIVAAGHTYADTWLFDQTYHWHAATCEHTNLVEDKAEHTFGDDNICTVCQAANAPDPTKPYAITYRLYEYNENKGDAYISSAYIDNSKNPSYYASTESVELETPKCNGYEFLGWFTADGTQVTTIAAGTNSNLTLYAHWNAITYDIVYKLFKTPVEDNISAEYKSYTVNKGLVNLPNPDIYNYNFLGWYTNDGVEVTNIPVGTYDNIELNAFFISKRNLTQPVDKLGDPIILENSSEGVIYFAYELGTIKNVPLSTLWTIQSVHGLTSQKSLEYTWSVTDEHLETFSNTIAKSTVDSGTWSVSENWSDTFEVSENWAQQHGMTKEEAKEILKTTTNGYSITYSSGGAKGTTKTDGTTTLDYDSTNTTDLESVEVNAEMGASVGTKMWGASFEINASLSATEKNSTETNTHSGTDTTNVDTTVTENSSSWNNASTSEYVEQHSTNESVKNVLSEIISNTKGYGQSYAKGGEGSESFGSSTSESETSSAMTTFVYTTSESKTESETYTTDGKTEGYYRQVVAGTVHVFGVVGYDVASKSYFHYTYNVLDDKVDLFLDYSPDGSFNDYEYSVLPFEVPYYVHEYVSSRTVQTDGLGYKTDSITGTAEIISYSGESKDVLVPTYISSGGRAYKVTGFSASAFAGKPIRSIVFSEYVEEIPNGAFKDCTSLEEISGFYTKIGEEAFSGCKKLKSFTVSSAVSEVGKDAFLGVSEIKVTALDAETAMELSKAMLPEEDGNSEADWTNNAQTLTQELVQTVVDSGADRVIVDISLITRGTKLNITVPQIAYFELNGDNKEYTDLVITSNAETTKLNEIVIVSSLNSSLTIASKYLILKAVSVTSNGVSLALTYDGAEVSLYKDTRLVSEKARTVVCKNAVINSQSEENVIGTLDVFGNIYVRGENGNVTVNTCPAYVTITSGKIIAIDEAQFNGYITGVYTITFDSNDGSTVADSSVIYGTAIGTLPTPTREGFTFMGWFDENGTKVTAETKFEYQEDITLKAKWQSGYVLATEVPEDAQIVSEKWTYDLTTNITSNQDSVDGYTLYDTTSEWGEYGEWSDWSTTKAIASDSREVETNVVAATYKTQYNYSRWCQYSDGGGQRGPTQGYWSGIACNYYKEKGWSDTKLPYFAYQEGIDKYGVSGDLWYNEVTRKVEVTPAYTKYRYRDRDLIYTYYHTKTETLESATEITETDSISNVQKWVQYIV